MVSGFWIHLEAWALLGVGSHMPYLGQLVKGLAAELEAINIYFLRFNKIGRKENYLL
jgi:hypothetical protein